MKVQVQEVGKTFGANVVFDWVELSVEEGEIVVLLGPNGAGKTRRSGRTSGTW